MDKRSYMDVTWLESLPGFVPERNYQFADGFSLGDGSGTGGGWGTGLGEGFGNSNGWGCGLMDGRGEGAGSGYGLGTGQIYGTQCSTVTTGQTYAEKYGKD